MHLPVRMCSKDGGACVNVVDSAHSFFFLFFSFLLLLLAVVAAPLLILIINMVGIRGEMYSKLYATQRPETEKSSGIVKAWNRILEILGFAAILCNVCILVFTFDLDLGSIDIQNVTTVHSIPTVVAMQCPSSPSTYETFAYGNVSNDWWLWLTSRVRFWELVTVVLLEHGLIVTKMALSVCISDKPQWVLDAIHKDWWEMENKKSDDRIRKRERESGMVGSGGGGGGGSVENRNDDRFYDFPGNTRLTHM